MELKLGRLGRRVNNPSSFLVRLRDSKVRVVKYRINTRRRGSGCGCHKKTR